MATDDDGDDDGDGEVKWVKQDAFVMPVLPKSLKVDPLFAGLLHTTSFLELSGDDTVDEDGAVEALEHVGLYFQSLPAAQLQSLQEQVQRVAEHARKKKWGEPAVEFFAEFFENFGIGGEEED